MMNQLIINYFQSHKSTIINLDPTGVNVIKGTSNSGKSSIVRNIRWLVENRPSGFGFRSDFAKNKDISSCSLSDGKTTVIRERNKVQGENAINGYQIYQEGQEPKFFEALKTDVPEEVKEALNMSALNLHSQHDKFFMLQESAGERGRMFNEYCNLSVIDTVMSKTDSMMRKTKQDLERAKKDLSDNKISLENLPNYEKYVTIIERLDDKIKTLSELKAKRQKIYDLAVKWDWLIESILELKRYGKIKKWIEEKSFVRFYALNELIENRKNIQTLVVKYFKLESEIEEARGWKDVLERIKKILPKVTNYIQLKESKKEISALVSNWNFLDSLILKLQLQRNHALIEFKKLLKESGTCPLCGAVQ